MHNGDKMVRALFQEDGKFTIILSVTKFKALWDESYALPGECSIEKYKDELGVLSNKIDLNSFVAEQILSILNSNGEEDESANNECFENYDALNCVVRDVVDGTVIVTGKLKNF